MSGMGCINSCYSRPNGVHNNDNIAYQRIAQTVRLYFRGCLCLILTIIAPQRVWSMPLSIGIYVTCPYSNLVCMTTVDNMKLW